jgi:oxygen-dependent protoporphyrinogen oxidase
VVGGGISGLAAAWFLHEADPTLALTVLDARPDVGGKLRLGEVAGAPLDLGAESVLLRRPEGQRLAEAVGLAMVPAATTGASIWSRGALHPVPADTLMGVPASVESLAASGLLTAEEIDRVRQDEKPSGEPVTAEVSVAEAVGSRLGSAVLDRLVEPLLGGVYAGRADQLSLRSTLPQLAARLAEQPSVLAAARAARAAAPAGTGPVFGAPRGGVGLLPGAVARASGADIRTSTTVRELHRVAAGWELVTGSAAEPQRVEADAVVLAVPPAPAARLLSGVAPTAATALEGIPTASSAVVALAYDAGAVNLPEGSGFLVPPVEDLLVKGVTFSSVKWGWHAQTAPGLVLVRASVGRFGEEAALQRGDTELVAAVRADLERLLGWTAAPVDAVVQRWGGGLPQYTVGHADRVAAVRAAVAEVPGLAVCGAAYDGVGIPACIATAERAVTGLLRQWAP